MKKHVKIIIVIACILGVLFLIFKNSGLGILIA